MRNISRVLNANRGEIAGRIIRACKSLGIETVAVASEADRESLPAKMADRSVCVGPPRALDSYLNINLLITAALGTHSDALRPGYGFLAEQPELAEVCGKNNIQFIGPSLIAKGKDRSQAIERMQYFLENFIVSGVETTVPFHRRLLKHPDFLQEE